MGMLAKTIFLKIQMLFFSECALAKGTELHGREPARDQVLPRLVRRQVWGKPWDARPLERARPVDCGHNRPRQGPQLEERAHLRTDTRR